MSADLRRQQDVFHSVPPAARGDLNPDPFSGKGCETRLVFHDHSGPRQ